MEQILTYSVYGSAIFLILIGIYVVLIKKNLIKIVIGMSLMDAGVHLLLVALGYIRFGTAPIFSADVLQSGQTMVDPVPQSLVLTAIVIGFGVTAVALALVIRLYRKHNTINIDEIKTLRW